jgi:hypothetical protein
MQQGQYQDADLAFPGSDAIRRGVTMLLFGGIGTWKTSFAGCWPKPIFLSVGVEGGDDALAMLPELYGIQPPPVYQITSAEMMLEKITRIVRDYKTMDVNTVVIDSITLYQDMWISQLMERKYANNERVQKKVKESGGGAAIMEMQDWGLLEMHVRDMVVRLHNTGLNVLWLALEKENIKTDPNSGARNIVGVNPAIRGGMNGKLCAMSKMVVWASKKQMILPGTTQMQTIPQYYTSPTPLAPILRHKYGLRFGNGMIADPDYGTKPTFKAVWDQIADFIYMT